MKAKAHFLSILAVAALLFPLALNAVEPVHIVHGHSSQARSQELAYASVFEHAYSHAPEVLATASREEQARAHQKLGNSWTASGPRANFNYLDDSRLNNTGQRELDAGLEWQLWAFGAKRNSQMLATAFGEEVNAWRDYLNLTVAGRVRTALADIRAAEVSLNQAQQARDSAQQLVDIAERQVSAGAAAQDDVLQAQTLLLAEEKKLLAARAALVDGERSYSLLTGLDTRPILEFSEQKTASEDITAQHPLLRFLQANVAIASGKVAEVRREAVGNPTLSLGMRSQRGDSSENTIDSLALGVSLPLGGGAQAGAKASDARRTLGDAQVELETARRQLQQRLHEVEHELGITRQALALGEEQVKLSAQRAQMARKAFALGETTMTQVVLTEQQYQIADTEQHLLQAQLVRLISEFNQTLGVLP